MVKVSTTTESSDLFVGFCIDKSGSMSSVRADVIGGFNTFKAEQLALPGSTTFSVTLFDNYTLPLHDGVAGENVADLDNNSYVPGGGTALFDAIGRTITSMENWLSSNPNFNGKTVLVVQTDGYENASHEFTSKKQISDLIQKKRDAGWAVIFMGADMDAFSEGGGLGVAAGSTLAYAAAAGGTGTAYKNLSHSTRAFRGGQVTADNYFAAPQQDVDLNTGSGDQTASDTSNLP